MEGEVMEERNAKVYSDEQLASELKNKRAAGGGAKALSIAGVILVVAGLMTEQGLDEGDIWPEALPEKF